MLYKIYNDKKIIHSKINDNLELENIFIEVDEKYYEDTYELIKIIMQVLAYSSDIKIYDFKDRNKIKRKVRSRNIN